MSDTLKQRVRKGPDVVGFYLHGPTRANPAANFTPAKLIQVLEAGLPMTELDQLQAALEVATEKLAQMLGISRATFQRRKGTERLDAAESDRVVRFARLLGQAIRVFGNREDARQWLNSPQFGLGNAVPLDFARTEVGAREVENLLGRIEYGVYS